MWETWAEYPEEQTPDGSMLHSVNFFFSSRRRHTSYWRDWSSDVCSSDLNCVGCHAHGGGGMGPPLIDSRWIYGSEPENIFATIMQGRPNGMPAFRGRIPQQQVWQIVAYVRSIGGLTPADARSQRDDDLFYKKPEARTPQKGPEGQPGRQP